ncbi:polysaccharide biosynthesis/export family protein [Magnetospirillum molischianum]|uniref:Putative Polysaccharide export protein n=1 Tax=Magnetospirillum molischianum DSM 120 TaxID=1150626 RepID=H8FWD4_MAGML|nr:polysaccharide biosynthesis/export family protein [Magnetospirillum molischianum]CCG42672.1 putative Polysaccharide export protein [Magnetospirillum molischianum DSM 120]
MTKLGRGMATLLVLAALTGCSSGREQSPAAAGFRLIGDAVPAYQVGAGDSLSIVLPYNPELNFEAPVGPDGRFTMPVVGSILAEGRTVPEIEADIDRALVERRIARNAQPSVSIRNYAPVVYVSGEVKQPGVIPLRGRMDPLQAISVAGGLLETARNEEVVVIRPGPDGRPLLRLVNLEALTDKGDPTQAVALQPQDTVFVPKSSIAVLDQWIDQYINKTLPFNRGVNYTINKNMSGSSQ